VTEIKKTKQFKDLLMSSNLEFLLESHNGISAKIAEEVGFRGLWASGLAISAQYGVRDSNEASWTQVLENIEFMSDAINIPIMLDGDTGYGNFNNVRRLVKKLEQRDIAAVCIEDKLYPKTNSFIDGDKQELADIDEFCSRIKAGKDAQIDDDFSIITRIEAFIAGWGLSEALRRAEAYHRAGSDAILIHSAKSDPSEILAFKKEWGDTSPVIVVPTKYYSTPTQVLDEAGFSIAIWANHMIRSSIKAMQESAKQIYESSSILTVEGEIASVKEVFRLQGVSELKEAEENYLPKKEIATKAIILAASRGEAMGSLTDNQPKAMIPLKDKSILEHISDTYRNHGINKIHVVRGYKKESINFPELNYIDNDDHETTSELSSFHKAIDQISGDIICSFGDVLFKPYLLQLLDECEDDLVIVIDTQWKDSVNKDRAADYVNCSQPHSRANYGDSIFLESAGENLGEDSIHGEWMGIIKISSAIFPTVRKEVDSLSKLENFDSMKMHHLLEHLCRLKQPIRVVYTTGNWLDVDTLEDVIRANNFL
jgi:phosphoenolpyruvate phosphomutase